MSLDSETLIKHCQIILQDRRIKNKIVVLCEGKGGICDKGVRRSPQSYSRMEHMPDANFYKKCVPRSWSQYTPVFFNCGDRQDVINSYFKLLELHETAPSESYLNTEKLFAIVDLDLQAQSINNYIFCDTEAIFGDLYYQGQVNEANAKQHRIWITGLIHKEAYFIIPELQETFNNLENSPFYEGNSLVLQDIYITMADRIITDDDLKSNLPIVSNRLTHCSELDCTGIEELRDSWKEQFKNVQDDMKKNELIIALLIFKKAKEYWKKIKPPQDWTGSDEQFREQLLLAIGNFYSEQSNYAKYHIPYFIKILREFVE